MPIYRYTCESCSETEEAIQKLSDPPLTTCEKCGGKLNKAIARTHAHFKGAGWASDGYGSSDGGGLGPRAGDVQAEAQAVAQEAASTGGDEAGKAAVHQYFDDLKKKSTE